jgi:single-strand DNA-binding protein
MSNVFSFVGTLGRDAEVKITQSGLSVLSFSAANNIGYGDKKQTLWIRVAVFGKKADGQLQIYLKKGQQVFVSGELSINEYIAKDGTNKTSLELNATIVDLIGGRDAGQQTGGQPAQKSNVRDDTPVDDYSDTIPF